MIESEYGWTDDQVLDLAVGRMRQIIEAIRMRVELADRLHRAYIEWQTKVTCSFIAAMSMDPKKMSQALDMITLLRDDERTKEEAPQGVAGEPPLGSAERLMSMLGPSMEVRPDAASPS